MRRHILLKISPNPFAKEGRGKIFRGLCLFYYGILGNCFYFLIRPSSFMITAYSTIFFFTRARDSSGPMNSVLKPF